MKRSFNVIGAVVLAVLIASSFRSVGAQEREADHEALRGMLRVAVQAVNERNFDLLPPMLHPNFTVISVDNQKFTSLDAFKTYWNGLFQAPGHLLDSIEVNAEADELTRFLDDNTGVAYGSSNDVYHFSNGDVRTMASRWSATVQKDPGGWKLVSLHLSANLFDNPVLDVVRSRALLYVATVSVVGLFLGGLIMFLVGRARRPKAGHA